MVADRNRVERIITEQLNGQQLNLSEQRLSREAQEALRNPNVRQQNEDVRLYNRMAAQIHLPPLALVEEPGASHARPSNRPHRAHEQAPRRTAQPEAHPAARPEVRTAPPAPGAPGSDAPIMPPAPERNLPPTVTIPNDRPLVNVPGVEYRSDALRPTPTRGGEQRYNPLAVPGLDAGTTIQSGISPRLDRQPNGQTTARYAGNANLLTGELTFNSERTTDAAGHLLHTRVEYSGSGTIVVDAGSGNSMRLTNPRSAETVYNPESRNYTTTFTMQDGRSLVATTDNTGRVQRLQEQR